MPKNTPIEDLEELPSKTAQKQVMHDLQALGEKLLDLTPKQLEKMPIDDNLRNAIEEAGRIKSRGALKRHKQFIGKLMRDIDPDPILAQFALFESAHQMLNKTFHHLEELREELIAGGKDIIGNVISEYPTIDKQKLRQLVKNAKKEHERNLIQPTDTSNKQGRLLFRFLRTQEQSELEGTVDAPDAEID
ncbi:hypothetical protein A9Q99_03940 [Gammaproteobacteria bacterium 45_16_T64]|nr:hypothetical protein A9Q99_03940 [Gammaproteobacteria bacterium 45_16_T64]